MTPTPDPIHSRIYAADRRVLQLLARCVEAAHLYELPSVTEVLTIQQCGYPRVYHLNDGLGPDLAAS